MKNKPVLALALAAVGCANYMKVEVEGRVVDEAGRPVAGAMVTTAPWNQGIPEMMNSGFMVSDKEGRFAGTLPRTVAPDQALFATVIEDGRGGFVVLPGEKASDLTVVVQPLTAVRAEIDMTKVPPMHGITIPFVHVTGGEPRRALVAHRPQGPASNSILFRLPRGSYELCAIGGGKPLKIPFEVKGEEVDLGTVAMEPFKHQTLLNREAPELHVADARGVPKEFKLRDLRGKWVVLIFWNHRMEWNPHVLPGYVELYESPAEVRNLFEILVIHQSDDVLTVRDLEYNLKRKGLRLPMPVIIDDGEKTFEAYGLERGPSFRSAPSEFLIDPEGRVAAYGFDVLRMLLLDIAVEKTSEK